MAFAQWSSEIHVKIMKHSLVVSELDMSFVFNIIMEQNSRKVTRRLEGTLDTEVEESTRCIEEEFFEVSSTLYRTSSDGSVEHWSTI